MSLPSAFLNARPSYPQTRTQNNHCEDAAWAPGRSPYSNTYVSTCNLGPPPYNPETGTWLEPQAIEQYVNNIVANRLAAMQLTPVNPAIAEDQLRAARRKQILGMTT